MQRRWSSLLFSLLLMLLASFAFRSSAFADTTQCQQVSVPVALSAGDEPDYHIAGWLCGQGNLSGKTLQLLVHGYTYDHTYWDFPYQEPNYSYVTSATNAGYATFAIDRIGVGQSSHPAPELVTVMSNAYVVHEIVQDLRAGSIGGVAFPKIVLVGHSLGTLISWQEAGTYGDVDGVIASGFVHVPSPTAVALVTTASYPADLDPLFVNSGLPVGYLTTIPGRRSIFYNAPDADPALMAIDETTKQTGTDSEIATFGVGVDPLLTVNIHVPVLSAMGQNDILCQPSLLFACNTSQQLVAKEAFAYSSHACLEGYVLPNSGHDMNLHLNATVWYTAANNWIAKRVGATVNTPPTQPCN